MDKKLEEHNDALTKADKDKAQHQLQIDKHNNQRQRYEEINKKFEENTLTENPQLSTSDSDIRHQITRGMITEVCYSAQTTVDGDHKVLIDYK